MLKIDRQVLGHVQRRVNRMQKKKAETIILRFRDLGIEVGQTIERHKRIIEKKKSCLVVMVA